MDLSSAETLTLCRRVFSALGAPAGLEQEIAAALIWLELRHVRILERLPQLLSEAPMPGTDPLQFELSDSALVFHLGDDKGFITLAPAVDCLIAQCMCENSLSVRAAIYNLAHIELIFPLLLAKRASRQTFKLQRGDFEAIVTHQGVFLTDSLNQIPVSSAAVPVAIDCLMDAAAYEPDRRAVDGKYTIGLDDSANRDRIDISANLYSRLKSVALDSMVPTTKSSAKLGAGAGLIDND